MNGEQPAAPGDPARPRLAAAGDQAAIQTLIAAAYGKYLARMSQPPAPMLADYAAAIAAGTVWVAGDPVIGVICLEPAADALLIENIAVHPAAQGTGIGHRLMSFAEHEARRRHLGRLTLYTSEVMSENLAIYLHLGYTEVDRRSEDGYRRVFLRKLLP